MRQKSKAKVQRVGYAAEINRSGETGRDNWERVGDLFQSSSSASVYLRTKFANVKKARVVGVRINVEPIGGFER